MKRAMTKRCRTRGAGVMVVLGLAVLSLLLAPAPVHAVSCGLVAHWVDTCAQGTDTLFSSAQHGQVALDSGPIFNLPLMFGNVTVFRGAGQVIPDHHIVTEMVSLSLTGGGLTLLAGDGIGNLLPDGPLHSPGRITENLDTLTAQSFFDVFFEISGAPLGALVLHNNLPCHMEATINRVPPQVNTEYLCISHPGHPFPVDLFDQDNLHVAILRGAVTHTIVPEPATLLLLGLGLAGVGAIHKRRRA